MALDPQVHDVIALCRARGMADFADLSVTEARSAFSGMTALQGDPEPVDTVVELDVPGPAGMLPTRIYRPREAEPEALLPLIVYLHGGGFVLGDLDVADRPCRALANAAGAVIASVQYRKAPEAPFPAAVLDCQAATGWLTEHADELGGDPTRIGVAGDSTGANLAAVVAQLALRQGELVLAVQLLLYPTTDFVGSWPSRTQQAKDHLLTVRDLDWFASHYLGAAGRRVDPADPLLSPLRAPDLSGLPPAMVVTAGFDPVRDEGLAYANALADAGVPVRACHNESMAHGFCWLAGSVDRAGEVIAEVGEYARTVFASATTVSN
ncbi:alpha/beta hydrolase [Pseudonocardia spinosispora]|uniref:alpha/beta hydrolase n=1 Tax=Pseudonocardia spinosispora TaxID=103441 RepID=UPI00041C0380|nr:alpha/beta hydrolase [Pseudonocardia spinosispora]